MESPFKFGKTVTGISFTNRKNEIGKLERNFRSGTNTIIISPRRWGKSSLVEKVMKNMVKNKDIEFVLLDLYAVNSEQSFLELFAREVIRSSSAKWQEWLSTVKDVFKQIVPKVSFGIDPQNDFSLGFEWEEARKYRDEILNLPEEVGKKKNVKFVICIDEFQRLADFPEYEDMEKLLRSVWQRQKNATYCLYGSKRQMMKEIFHNSSKPFYRFGEIILLEKIDKKEWIKFIITGFKKVNKIIHAKDAEVITDLMGNHPWYVQQMCQSVQHISGKKIIENDIEKALEMIIGANIPFYEREIENLSLTQLNLLKAIYQREKMLTSARVMQEYALGTPNNVRKNKSVLEERDIVDFHPKSMDFLDPVFERWFGRVFFNI